MVVAQHCEGVKVLNATESFTLKWLVLYYMKFTSKKKKRHSRVTECSVAPVRLVTGLQLEPWPPGPPLFLQEEPESSFLDTLQVLEFPLETLGCGALSSHRLACRSSWE